MDALATGLLAFLALLSLYLGHLSFRLWAQVQAGERRGDRVAPGTEEELQQLSRRLARTLELMTTSPNRLGRWGEESLEVALNALPRRCWQRQPLLSNGNRPDFLLTLTPDLQVAVDSKMLGLSDPEQGEALGSDALQNKVCTQGAQLQLRYLEPGNRLLMVLMVLPAGVHGHLTAATLRNCHERGVVPTTAEGLTALALLLVQLQPWLSQTPEMELVRGLSATRRSLQTSLELLERSSRQQRNARENLERARQLMEGARTRLEALPAGQHVRGHSPILEEALET